MSEQPGTDQIGYTRFLTRDNISYVLGMVFAVVAAVAAFIKHADAWPMFALSALCFMAPDFARLIKLRATTSGVEAEWAEVKKQAQTVTHEAADLIKTLRQAAIENSSLSLELVQRSGWVGGFEEDVKQSILDTTVARLKEIGVSDEEREGMLDRVWHRFEHYTYAFSILGRVHGPVFGHPRPFDAEDPGALEAANKFREDVNAEWKTLRDRWPGEPATPDELAKFIEKIGDDRPERRELLDAYVYYVEHKTHRDLRLWAKRNDMTAMRINTIPEIGDNVVEAVVEQD